MAQFKLRLVYVAHSSVQLSNCNVQYISTPIIIILPITSGYFLWFEMLQTHHICASKSTYQNIAKILTHHCTLELLICINRGITELCRFCCCCKRSLFKSLMLIHISEYMYQSCFESRQVIIKQVLALLAF